MTAQTYAPEQYKVLLKRANFMLGKAFERGDQEIGIVQALSILSCWKEPHDKGGWLRLGYAIRYVGFRNAGRLADLCSQNGL